MNRNCFPSYCRRGWTLLVVLGLGLGRLAAHAAGLQWSQHDGWREAPLTVPAGGKSGFTLIRPEQSGLLFTNQPSYARSEANQNLLNGCGVAAGDFDGDGNCDLYFANCEGANALFRNLGGWRFENVTRAAGVEATNQSTKGVVFADVNGDGQLDLFAASLGGPNALFLNLGGGHFTNITAAAGLLARAGAGAHSAAFADVDGDGDLDLYVANYGEVSILRSGGSFSQGKVNGKDTVTGRWARRLKIIDGILIELGEADTLYLNDGNGHFSAQSWTSGAFLNEQGQPLRTEPLDMGLSVMFRDINGDGAPDIYVCNDFQTPDRIWINDGKGHFRALPDLALRVTPHFSMGVDFADIDRDGFDDFFVGDMLSRRHKLRMTQMGETNPPPARLLGERVDRQQIRRNVLAWNRGDGTYADIAEFAGVAASDWTWSVAFLDVDLDGYEDLLAVNAHAYDTQDLDMITRSPSAVTSGSNRQIGKSLRDFPPLITPNYLFRNRGNRTFEERGAAWGFDSTNISHGIALGDFDNDGDVDIAVSCLGQPPLLYRNETSAARVAVRLRGLAPNTHGIGARIKLLDGAVPIQSQEIQCGGRYLSADEAMRTFAAGSVTEGMTLEVSWRSGRRSVISGVKANVIYEVDEAGAKEEVQPKLPVLKPWFSDVSTNPDHFHEQAPFDDLARQPMLIRSLSRQGPGVAWWDLDGDGHEELIIGAGKQGRLSVFKVDAAGRFAPWNAVPPALVTNDPGGLAGWNKGLLSGLSSYREASGALAAIRGSETGPALTPFPAISLGESSAGPVATADIDGDGDLDVFVGGRVNPGRYPEAASSVLLRNHAGQLAPDPSSVEVFKKVGLVSAAVFSDLDGDGLPELILACEWGPLKIFRNVTGKYVLWDAPIRSLDSTTNTLGQFVGWWNSVTTGDLDGDGRMDIIAGNWGLNHSHAHAELAPARLYFGDLDGNGTVDLIEAETDPESGRIVPKRNLALLSLGMPALRARFPTHAAFSTADMSAVLGDKFGKTPELRAVEFRSMVLLNRGNYFEAMPLPDEAQWAPAFGLNVADFDGDGREDLFLAQNFFAQRPEEARTDAGRGLVLRGTGEGRFQVLPGQTSGVIVYGEQRGSAVGDFDGDGREDLVVTQPGGATKLFHNESAKPGLRVRLEGTAGNPQGIGAAAWLGSGGKNGATRELHGGSGYWSQDSAVFVLSMPQQQPAQIHVRWPGGKLTSGEVPAGAAEIRVSLAGKVEKVR